MNLDRFEHDAPVRPPIVSRQREAQEIADHYIGLIEDRSLLGKLIGWVPPKRDA